MTFFDIDVMDIMLMRLQRITKFADTIAKQ